MTVKSITQALLPLGDMSPPAWRDKVLACYWMRVTLGIYRLNWLPNKASRFCNPWFRAATPLIRPFAFVSWSLFQKCPAYLKCSTQRLPLTLALFCRHFGCTRVRTGAFVDWKESILMKCHPSRLLGLLTGVSWSIVWPSPHSNCLGIACKSVATY